MLSSSSSYYPANVASGSLADLSAANGSYLLFAPLGQVHVSALDLSRFDRGEASATLAYAESVLTLDPVIRATVPSVVALTPDNGASGVDPAARIVVTFSEPIERSSITSASIVLSSSDNTPEPVGGQAPANERLVDFWHL